MSGELSMPKALVKGLSILLVIYREEDVRSQELSCRMASCKRQTGALQYLQALDPLS